MTKEHKLEETIASLGFMVGVAIGTAFGLLIAAMNA